ncbi:MAG: lipid-A-disaccharide synthase [Thermovirgaceae bacterium]|nr:lipid-A-disaccharide synthase [Thermovirgaceae bacterium]
MGYSGDGDHSGSLFIGCGEASGDHYASLLVGALRSAGFGGEIWGMLGSEGQQAGGDAVWNSGSLSLMGISEVFSAIPRLMRLKNEMAAEIMVRNPAAVVVIDSPDFSIPLLKALKKKGYGGSIFYLAPPTVWAWRQGRADDLAELCDICFPLFDFERVFLASRGVECRWFGHPLVKEIQGIKPTGKIAANGEKIVALLPGSRRSEVRNLLPVLLEAARGLRERGFSPVFSVAPGLDEETSSGLKRACSGWSVFEGPGAELMAASETVIGASGTATVEALILRKFTIVLYKASWSSWVTYKLLVRTPWISIPNILAGESVFPELLQSEASAANIFRHFDRYHGSRGERERIDASMNRADAALGDGDAPGGWANSIMEMLKT